MNLLAIDTSTERATVALSVGDNVYQEEQGDLRQHAPRLLPMVQRVLANASMQLNQLDGIVFGRGPGSFTGLRVTCSVAKALAYAHDLPMFPVSSLAAIAKKVYDTIPDGLADTAVLAVLDARMQQLYWSSFTQDCFFPVEYVTDAKDIVTSANTVIVAGVGLETYEADFSVSFQKKIVKRYTIYPEASAMIRLVRQCQVQSVGASEALPAYVRDPQYARVHLTD